MSETLMPKAAPISASSYEVDPYAVPLEKIDLANTEMFRKRQHWPFFERLRKEDPVHYNVSEEYGPFWSVTRYEDIMTVETNHDVFSSEPTIFLEDPEEDFQPESFITLDPPKHDSQRKVVNPAVAPVALRDVEGLIRQRTQTILDSLPVGKTFNWVDDVSIELTTQMLATLFDFPFEERHKLIRWSDLTTIGYQMGLERDQIIAELMECHQRFAELLAERASAPPKQDFISLMAHDPVMSKQLPMELLGNLMLLIVGGNDTTRNSMSGSVLELHQHPAEFAKLKQDPSLISNMVSEVIRWQTPLAYMRRTALADFELGGKQIKKGDKVLMWYISGNRDEAVIERPNEFLIDRKDARRHISFGFGIHRCMGNRLAEMQLRVLWEEILARFEKVEVVGEPENTPSFFVHGIANLPVRLIAK